MAGAWAFACRACCGAILASLLCGSFERRVFVARVVVAPVIVPAQLDKPLRHQPVDRLPGDVQLEPCLLLLSDWRL